MKMKPREIRLREFIAIGVYRLISICFSCLALAWFNDYWMYKGIISLKVGYTITTLGSIGFIIIVWISSFKVKKIENEI